jgi:hypothetical protein
MGKDFEPVKRIFEKIKKKLFIFITVLSYLWPEKIMSFSHEWEIYDYLRTYLAMR